MIEIQIFDIFPSDPLSLYVLKIKLRSTSHWTVTQLIRNSFSIVCTFCISVSNFRLSSTLEFGLPVLYLPIICNSSKFLMLKGI